MATSTINKISECKREIEMEISAKETSAEFDRVVSQLSRRAKVPGFRPGKVPKEMVKRRYADDIRESLISALIPKALQEELKSHGLNPVDSPVIQELDYKEGNPLRAKVLVEVWPEFSLPPYKNIQVNKKSVNVTAKDVGESLRRLQDQTAQYEPVKGRGVGDGDYVVVELSSREAKTNKAFPKEKIVILAGHPDNEKILNRNLTGMKLGEEKAFSISYGQDHAHKRLAGKDIEYNIKILEIKQKDLPEINDDFAKGLGEYKGLKDLKDQIRKEIKNSKEQELRQEMVDEILNKILEMVSIELPESAVQKESIRIIRQILSSQPQGSLSKEEVEKLNLVTRKRAQKSLKENLILTQIADAEKIQVSEDELSEELKAIAKANRVPLAQVIQTVNKQEKREELLGGLRLRKAVDFLLDNAIIR